jgi:palmitoyltransferase
MARITPTINPPRTLTVSDPSKPWPPPDPDRMFRAARKPPVGDGFTQAMDIESFRARQTADMARYEDMDGDYVVRRRPFHERLEAAAREGEARVYELEDDYEEDEEVVVSDDDGDEAFETPSKKRKGVDNAGEEGWRNREGERLADFGVDEVADFYDEDDVPLAELLRRRKAGQ